jgi:glutamate/tyrosine decarboxylase-like PLP-dependent enzyme
MKEKQTDSHGRSRASALDMSAADFRETGHRLIEQIAEYYESLSQRKLTAGKSRSQIQNLIGTGGLPDQGTAASALMEEIAPLIFENSLHNGHPRFLGYISASAAPLGALAELLAAAVNSNVAKWELSPVASEIETQAIRWIAELIGYPADCGGIMVSGGNAANFHGFVAARQAVTRWDMRNEGLYGDSRKLTAYVSKETHTWIDKAAEICGLGASAVRWIETDNEQRIDLAALQKQVEADRRDGNLPFLVVATTGTISTGAIDPVRDMAKFCEEQGIWLHVDGAYGAPAACLDEAPDDLHALALADSVAIDPHKWLHSPIEAACILTRDPDALRNAFDFRPDYYRFNDEAASGIDYYQHGLQNSRGFRALKVWLGLRQAGRDGYSATIREDIALARLLFDTVDTHPDFEARSLNLSVTTFRYVPAELQNDGDAVDEYLNELNKTLLAEVQRGGQAFVSNAIVDGDYLLRACVVNFRTTESDIHDTIKIIAGIGKSLDERMRATYLAA